MWSCLGWLVGAGRGGCARCRVVFSVCSSSGRAVRAVAVVGAGSSWETPGPGLPPPPVRRSRQLVPGDAGPRLLCRCARAPSWVEVNALWGR